MLQVIHQLCIFLHKQQQAGYMLCLRVELVTFILFYSDVCNRILVGRGFAVIALAAVLAPSPS